MTAPQPVERRLAARLLALGKRIHHYAGWLVPVLTVAGTLMLTAVGAAWWWFIPGAVAVCAVVFLGVMRHQTHAASQLERVKVRATSVGLWALGFGLWASATTRTERPSMSLPVAT